MWHAVTIICILAPLIPFMPAQYVGITVQTSSGPVTGHPAKHRPTVSEYLGIPYAKPPVGDLRFDAPQRFSSQNPLIANTYSPDCPQKGLTSPPLKYPGQTPQFKPLIESFAGGRGNPQSEDCLTLNIWAKDSRPDQKRGVLVWFHGGRFTIGDSNTPFYNGEYLADNQDIIVITVNYRLNIFGFSGAPGQPANAGLLDQRLAVEWVRDNIEGFGGDPHRITIMGQSAGGAAVDFWTYAYADDPIVAGAIPMSGTALSFEPNTPDFSRYSFLTAASSVNCTGDDTAILACMRKVEYTQLISITPKVKPLPTKALAQPVFHPTVNNITVFPRESYKTLGAAGTFAKIPILAGNTDHESGFYRLAAGSQNRTLSTSQWNLYELQGFTCPARDSVSYRIAQGIQAWRYRYYSTFPSLELYPGSGAYHGVDLHMIFGASQDVTGIAPSEEERLTTEYMQRAWAAFVNDPQHGLEQLGWPLYREDGEGNCLVQLGKKEDGCAVYEDPRVYDDQCPRDGSVKEAQGAF